VHNVQFKMVIKKDSDFWYDHEVALKGWVRKYTWIGNVNVEKTTKHIIIRFGVGDPDPWRAAYKALETALNMKRLLEEMAGYKLGELIQIGKPKWEILGDPVAGEVAKKQVVVTDSGAIDNTPDPGTLHFYDPEDVVTYLRMPKEVRKIHQEIAEVKKEVRQMPEIIAVMMKEMAINIGKEVAAAIIEAPSKTEEKEDFDRELDGYA